MGPQLSEMDTDGSDPRRNAVLESARHVFAEKGFVEATISEISRGAGIADSAAYKYFKGKEEICTGNN